MAEFHHHPDGLIYLRNGAESYAAPLAEFALDLASCNLPAYPGLPQGYRERRYVPGGVHAVFSADSQAQAGSERAGDYADYLAAIPTLLAAQSTRMALPVQPES